MCEEELKVECSGFTSSLLAYIVPTVLKGSAAPCATVRLYVIFKFCEIRLVIFIKNLALLSCSLQWGLIITASVQYVPCLLFVIFPLPLFLLLFVTAPALQTEYF